MSVLGRSESMIKCEKGSCQIKGDESVLFAELSVIIKALRNAGMDDSVIKHSIDVGFLSDEEIREKAKDTRREIVAMLMKMMADIKDLEDEEE
jgi:hypothetical protein